MSEPIKKKVSIIDIVNASCNMNRKSNRIQSPKWRFYPTEASCVSPRGKVIGKCLRQRTYQWLGYKVTNEVNDFVKGCGAVGMWLEDQMIEEFKKKGIYLEERNARSVRKQQVPILDDDSVLSGEVDIYIGGGTQEAGVEAKSYFNSTNNQSKAPKEAHLLQTFLYLCLFEPKQPYFLIVYRPNPFSDYSTQGEEGKLTFRIDVVEVDGEKYPVIDGKVDSRIKLSNILERYALIKKHVKGNILPKREFSRSSKSCKQCNYADQCWITDSREEGKEL
jgi:CRISPR/Cas system-associated exonuclease Cas4 (RecB family)